MKKLLVVAALLCVASVASADLQWGVTEVTGANHTSRGLRAFAVTLTGQVAGADEFAAVDGNLSGPLSQCWANGSFATPGLNMPWAFFPNATALDVDTHLEFDLAGAGVIIAQLPTEDNDLPAGKLEDIGSYQRGTGQNMNAAGGVNFAFAVPAAAQALVTPFAHVVVPNSSDARLTGIAVAKDGTGVPIDHLFIPEPATLGLLAIGGIGALIRRRR